MSATTSGAVAPDAPARRPWVAPLAATLVTLPLSAVTYLIALFSAMGCDACAPEESARFDSAFTVGFRVVRCALFLAFVLLMTAWTLPTAPRGGADPRALVAFAAPVTVLLSLLGFACILASAT